MKHVAITFDDGRSDNYTLAKNIMDKYCLRGTVYITTGFIDNSWEGKDILRSPTRPLAIEEIVALQQSGWEIGLHGDKHQTEVNDMRNALTKLRAWGIENEHWGISVPNSVTEESDVVKICDSEYGKNILYIRRGRKCDTGKLWNRILYGLYNIFGFKWAYRHFNRENSFIYGHENPMNIPSVVVKSNDKPEMIVDFIKHLPDESIVVLMLHSILPQNHPLCGKDSWSWEEYRFDAFCAGLKHLIEENTVVSVPLMQILER